MTAMQAQQNVKVWTHKNGVGHFFLTLKILLLNLKVGDHRSDPLTNIFFDHDATLHGQVSLT